VVITPAVAPLRAVVKSTVAPSLNVTDPVGVPPPALVTVAVKDTACPGLLGLTEDATVVVVAVAAQAGACAKILAETTARMPSASQRLLKINKRTPPPNC
jgi:hypothetical protein